jgi:uncharacterized protein (TIGR02217 family)
MADIGIFPTLVGQGWSVKKTPTFQTRIQRSVSGRELRLLDYPYPLWQFEVSYEALGDNLGSASNAMSIGSLLATDLRTLMGFSMACQGAFATFLYFDPTDNTVLGQPLGTGDGSTTTMQLIRTFGVPPPSVAYFTEPMTAPSVESSGQLPPGGAIYFNGVLVPPADYIVSGTTGIVTFNSAPAAGAAVTASFSYYFRCRFMSDAYQFENFMYRLWKLQKLDFISVLP